MELNLLINIKTSKFAVAIFLVYTHVLIPITIENITFYMDAETISRTPQHLSLHSD